MKYDRGTLINGLISQELLEEACPSHYGLTDKFCIKDYGANCRQCWSEALDKALKESDGE